MPETHKKPNLFSYLAAIAGSVVAYRLSQYCGSAIMVPGVALFLLWLLFAKTPLRPKFFAGAISVTGAHVIWFIVGSVVAGVRSAAALDIVVLLLGLIWLWVRPSLGAALFLGVVQLSSLVVNAISLNSVDLGSSAHRALTAHCVFRLVAVTCLVAGYIRMRRAKAIPEVENAVEQSIGQEPPFLP
jgi:hypothetical protein